MHRFKYVIMLFICVGLSGCANTVPLLGLYGGRIDKPKEGQERSQKSINIIGAINQSLFCQTRNAIRDFVLDDRIGETLPGSAGRSADFFEDWVVQTVLVLTVEENLAVAPSATFTPVFSSPISTFAASVSGAKTATSVQTFTSSFLVADQLNGVPEKPFTKKKLDEYKDSRCDHKDQKPHTLYAPLVKNSVPIYEGLSVHNIALGTTSAGPATNAIQLRFQFELEKTGAFNPGFGLTEFAINPAPSLLSGSRGQTHDFSVTFGPPSAETRRMIARERASQRDTRGKQKALRAQPPELAPTAAAVFTGGVIAIQNDTID